MNIAIITGASSGLGREFALQLCHNYAAEIDEIWLLARRKEPLLTLAQEISATGICVGAAMPMDITDKEQMKDFQDKLEIEVPTDRKSTRLNSSHIEESRMPSSA